MKRSTEHSQDQRESFGVRIRVDALTEWSEWIVTTEKVSGRLDESSTSSKRFLFLGML